MKKLIIATLSIFSLSGILVAQTTSESLQLARTQNLGTARYNGLSGAFGALGGDLTAIAENPAGSAVFLNSFGSATLSTTNTNLDANYFGTQTSTTNNNANFNQIGGVLVLKNYANEATGVTKIALSIAYNQDNDYRSQFNARGNTNNSIANYFVGEASGFRNDAIALRGDTLTDAYIDIGDNPNLGASGQRALLGSQAFLISPISDADNETNYLSDVPNEIVTQNINRTTSGSSGKIAFNIALELNKNLYLGANLNVHQIDKRVRTTLTESNSFARVTYQETKNTSGSGISSNFGVIYKTNHNIRLGVSYQTPTLSTLTDEVDQFVELDFVTPLVLIDETTIGSPEITIESQSVDPNIIFQFPEYDLRTPGILSGSIAYVFGKQGLLSAQYSRQDFSNIRYSGDFTNFDDINRSIKDTFQAVNTFKLGGEYRYEKWSLRTGYSFISSPYKDSRIAGDTNGYSFGAGYDWGKWKLDLAYNRIESDQNNAPFENANFSNSAAINNTSNIFTATVGVNF